MDNQPTLVPSNAHQSRARVFESYALGACGLTVAVCAVILTLRAWPLLGQATQLTTDTQRTVAVTGGEEAKFWKNDYPGLRQKVEENLDATKTTIAGIQPVEQQLTQVAKDLSAEAVAIKATTDQATVTLAAVQSQATAVGADAGAALTSGKEVLDATKVTIQGLQPVETSATSLMDNTNVFVKTLPPISDNVKTITGNFGAASTDFETKFHFLLFPKPCLTFGCKLAKTWPYIKGAAQMAEPLYWGQQLFENHAP